MTALDQVSSWQMQSLPAAWQLCAVHLPHITHPCNLVMLPPAFGNSTVCWVVGALTLLVYPSRVDLLRFQVSDFRDVFTRKDLKTKEICLEPHFAIKEGARNINNKCITKMIQCVPLPSLLMLKHPVSAGTFIAFLLIAEVRQRHEPDSSRHCTGASTCMYVASSSPS